MSEKKGRRQAGNVDFVVVFSFYFVIVKLCNPAEVGGG